jgi:hypothetical protein
VTTAAAPTFAERLNRIIRTHRRYANGVKGRMGADGLVSPVPRRTLPRFPWPSLIILLAVAMTFKGWMYAELGAAEYTGRLAVLSDGGVMGQAGAVIMAADPVTVTIGGWWERLGV